MLSDINIKHAKNLCCAHLGFLRLFLLLLVLFWSFWLWWLCFFGSAATTKPRMQSREKTWTKNSLYSTTLVQFSQLWGENHPAHCQKAQKLLLSCQLQCLGLVWPRTLCALTSFALFSCWYQSFTRTAMSPSKNIRPSVGFGSVLLDLRFGQATPQTIVRTFKIIQECLVSKSLGNLMGINKSQKTTSWDLTVSWDSWGSQCFGAFMAIPVSDLCGYAIFGWIWKGLWLVGIIFGLSHA